MDMVGTSFQKGLLLECTMLLVVAGNCLTFYQTQIS